MGGRSRNGRGKPSANGGGRRAQSHQEVEYNAGRTLHSAKEIQREKNVVLGKLGKVR